MSDDYEFAFHFVCIFFKISEDFSNASAADFFEYFGQLAAKNNPLLRCKRSKQCEILHNTMHRIIIHDGHAAFGDLFKICLPSFLVRRKPEKKKFPHIDASNRDDSCKRGNTWDRHHANTSSGSMFSIRLALRSTVTPSMTCAGSPGTMRTSTNTKVSTAHTVNTARPRRLIKIGRAHV